MASSHHDVRVIDCDVLGGPARAAVGTDGTGSPIRGIVHPPAEQFARTDPSTAVSRVV